MKQSLIFLSLLLSCAILKSVAGVKVAQYDVVHSTVLSARSCVLDNTRTFCSAQHGQAHIIHSSHSVSSLQYGAVDALMEIATYSTLAPISLLKTPSSTAYTKRANEEHLSTTADTLSTLSQQLTQKRLYPKTFFSFIPWDQLSSKRRALIIFLCATCAAGVFGAWMFGSYVLVGVQIFVVALCVTASCSTWSKHHTLDQFGNLLESYRNMSAGAVSRDPLSVAWKNQATVSATLIQWANSRLDRKDPTRGQYTEASTALPFSRIRRKQGIHGWPEYMVEDNTQGLQVSDLLRELASTPHDASPRIQAFQALVAVLCEVRGEVSLEIQARGQESYRLTFWHLGKEVCFRWWCQSDQDQQNSKTRLRARFFTDPPDQAIEPFAFGEGWRLRATFQDFGEKVPLEQLESSASDAGLVASHSSKTFECNQVHGIHLATMITQTVNGFSESSALLSQNSFSDFLEMLQTETNPFQVKYQKELLKRNLLLQAPGPKEVVRELVSNCADINEETYLRSEMMRKPHIVVVQDGKTLQVVDHAKGMNLQTLICFLLNPNASSKHHFQQSDVPREAHSVPTTATRLVGQKEGKVDSIGRFGQGFFATLSYLKTEEDWVKVRSVFQGDSSTCYKLKIYNRRLLNSAGKEEVCTLLDVTQSKCCPSQPFNVGTTVELFSPRVQQVQEVSGGWFSALQKYFRYNTSSDIEFRSPQTQSDGGASQAQEHLVNPSWQDQFEERALSLDNNAEAKLFVRYARDDQPQCSVTLLVKGAVVQSFNLRGWGLPAELLLHFPARIPLGVDRHQIPFHNELVQQSLKGWIEQCVQDAPIDREKNFRLLNALDTLVRECDMPHLSQLMRVQVRHLAQSHDWIILPAHEKCWNLAACPPDLQENSGLRLVPQLCFMNAAVVPTRSMTSHPAVIKSLISNYVLYPVRFPDSSVERVRFVQSKNELWILVSPESLWTTSEELARSHLRAIQETLNRSSLNQKPQLNIDWIMSQRTPMLKSRGVVDQQEDSGEAELKSAREYLAQKKATLPAHFECLVIPGKPEGYRFSDSQDHPDFNSQWIEELDQWEGCFDRDVRSRLPGGVSVKGRYRGPGSRGYRAWSERVYEILNDLCSSSPLIQDFRRLTQSSFVARSLLKSPQLLFVAKWVDFLFEPLRLDLRSLRFDRDNPNSEFALQCVKHLRWMLRIAAEMHDDEFEVEFAVAMRRFLKWMLRLYKSIDAANNSSQRTRLTFFLKQFLLPENILNMSSYQDLVREFKLCEEYFFDFLSQDFDVDLQKEILQKYFSAESLEKDGATQRLRRNRQFHDRLLNHMEELERLLLKSWRSEYKQLFPSACDFFGTKKIDATQLLELRRCFEALRAKRDQSKAWNQRNPDDVRFFDQIFEQATKYIGSPKELLFLVCENWEEIKSEFLPEPILTPLVMDLILQQQDRYYLDTDSWHGILPILIKNQFWNDRERQKQTSKYAQLLTAVHYHPGMSQSLDKVRAIGNGEEDDELQFSTSEIVNSLRLYRTALLQARQMGLDPDSCDTYERLATLLYVRCGVRLCADVDFEQSAWSVYWPRLEELGTEAVHAVAEQLGSTHHEEKVAAALETVMTLSMISKLLHAECREDSLEALKQRQTYLFTSVFPELCFKNTQETWPLRNMLLEQFKILFSVSTKLSVIDHAGLEEMRRFTRDYGLAMRTEAAKTLLRKCTELCWKPVIIKSV